MQLLLYSLLEFYLNIINLRVNENLTRDENLRYKNGSYQSKYVEFGKHLLDMRIGRNGYSKKYSDYWFSINHIFGFEIIKFGKVMINCFKYSNKRIKNVSLKNVVFSKDSFWIVSVSLSDGAGGTYASYRFQAFFKLLWEIKKRRSK